MGVTHLTGMRRSNSRQDFTSSGMRWVGPAQWRCPVCSTSNYLTCWECRLCLRERTQYDVVHPGREEAFPAQRQQTAAAATWAAGQSERDRVAIAQAGGDTAAALHAREAVATGAAALRVDPVEERMARAEELYTAWLAEQQVRTAAALTSAAPPAPPTGLPTPLEIAAALRHSDNPQDELPTVLAAGATAHARRQGQPLQGY